MRPKTNRLLMLLVGVAIAGCSSQTERSSSGAGGQAQPEYERVVGSTNAVTKEELERRAAAKAAAAEAAPQVAPAPEAVKETPPPKPAAVATAPKDEATPDFPVTKYELPDESANAEEVEDIGPQDDDSASAEQDPTPAEESSVGDTIEYADDQQQEAADSEEIEDIGPQDDDSASAEQDPTPTEESSVGDTTEYADDQQQEAADSGEVEDLGTQADESGTVTYPEDDRAAADKVVGDPTIYSDEPIAQAAPPVPKKSAPATSKTVSVSFETEPLFNFDKAQIRKDQGAKLDEFISSLGGTQYDSIAVVGHADRIGTEAYNQKLSERRAEAVKTYLVRKGVPADKVNTEGRGKSESVTGDACAKTRGKTLISCLQPDRKVDVSVNATKQSN